MKAQELHSLCQQPSSRQIIVNCQQERKAIQPHLHLLRETLSP